MKKDKNHNPTGKGGFKDNPQNRANGRWRKEDSIPYQQNYFLSLSKEEFDKFPKENPNMTMAQELAYNSVKEGKVDIAYLKEVTDRTAGRPQQSVDHTTNGKDVNTPIFGSNPLDE